ncbi:NrfD/PsrC family molybdoenzyme membrane anchor subunit [Denitrobacterium detoxificans]|jgi:molybdopterin-containing oxidoreductase family membrane subunit|uniref:NrfD/PsrC family molybdoenzyme membrane anchor subunit n=1 Tax=Denitrobacterium detoxificans TaxID=79604 RepID=UPI0026F3617C|nr:NrfD/PsrC family molybdoenzyme membrane anchor subunit [Denitrobacterium detoxificans]MBE6466675.1 oxidoreductase [Denitrobacterium detoxificans]
MFTSSKAKSAVVALTILVIAGISAWVYQLANGLAVTGMSNINSWGAYIIMFMLFVGLSAGGLIVASSAHVFNIEQFKKVALPAVITSTVCICCAGLFILLDLGGIQRVWRILTGPNPSSVLVWDMTIITIYLVINILDLVLIIRGHEHKVEVLSRIALPVAILVHSVTAWIFGLQIARAWYSAIMAPIFVASAMDSGLALLIIALAALERAGIFTTGAKLFKGLSGLLAVFIAVDAFFIGCELLTMAYPGAGEAVELGHMLQGATAPFFWFEIICGLLIPFLILVFSKNREKRGLVIGASALVVLGVFAKRVWLLLTSFITPNVEGANGISLGTFAAQADAANMWAQTGSYAPTVIEILVIVGVISLGALAFIILSNKMLKRNSAEPAADTQSTTAE